MKIKKHKRPQGTQLTCSPMHGQTERMKRKKEDSSYISEENSSEPRLISREPIKSRSVGGVVARHR